MGAGGEWETPHAIANRISRPTATNEAPTNAQILLLLLPAMTSVPSAVPRLPQPAEQH
ncbi:MULTISPECIES: hypothetical protein [Streptomyces]|uniref:hypothetical protein n=1 Tax=Streptomyces TaxID=1883 RepID=UPI000ABFFFAA|nr:MULTISPECIES: hypothetical protein [Streptomyces]